jgi:orotate phosphoribosyltransferase
MIQLLEDKERGTEIYSKAALIQQYIAREALKTGTFTLASGATSDFYIDGRVVTTHPDALRIIAKMFHAVIESERLLPEGASLVVPGGVGGIPIGTALSLELGRPFVIDRGEKKAHGLTRRFEGVFDGGDLCLVVDDLVTQGGTIRKTIEALREQGKRVTDALVIVDREEGGCEELGKMGVHVHALVTKAELRQAVVG